MGGSDPDPQRVPAIVLGRGATAVGVLRCLHLAGIPAFVACPPGDQVTRSRWYRPTPGTAIWHDTTGAAAEQALREMPLSEAVLIPSADDTALWLADLPQGDLGRRFRVSTSSRRSLEILQDKVKFAQFLGDTDIPYPRTFNVESDADLAAIPLDTLDRVFIKPANSQKFSDVTGAKGVWVNGRGELRRAWHDLHAQGFKLMVQEYVPGAPSDHYFVDGFRDRDGNLTGLFARRRTRIYPPDFGNSSYCRSIALGDIPTPIEHLAGLLEKLDYRGIFSAEFKRDARDGAFRILEVNTRAWTYVEFAARCGVNVCAMACQDALERSVSVAPRDYVVGAGCVDFYRDVSSVRSTTTPARDSLFGIVPQWAGAHFHTFRWDDPGPGLFAAWNIVSDHVQRIGRRGKTRG